MRAFPTLTKREKKTSIMDIVNTNVRNDEPIVDVTNDGGTLISA